MKKKFLYFIKNFELVTAAAMLMFMSFVIILQVIMRFVFHNSLAWSEELARYLFVWITYLGTSYAVTAEKHMRVDAFVSIFPKKIQFYLHIFSDVACLIFFGIVAYCSLGLVTTFMQTGQMAASIKIPTWILYASVLAGAMLTAVRLIQHMVKLIRNNRR